jgi:hypothetical protein
VRAGAGAADGESIVDVDEDVFVADVAGWGKVGSWVVAACRTRTTSII